MRRILCIAFCLVAATCHTLAPSAVGAPRESAPAVTTTLDFDGTPVTAVSRPSYADGGNNTTALHLETDLTNVLRHLPLLVNGVLKDEACGERVELANATARLEGGELVVTAHVDYRIRICQPVQQTFVQAGQAVLAFRPVAPTAERPGRVAVAGRTLDLRVESGSLTSADAGDFLKPLLMQGLDFAMRRELAKEENGLTIPPEWQAMRPRFTRLELAGTTEAPRLIVDVTLAAPRSEVKKHLETLLKWR